MTEIISRLFASIAEVTGPHFAVLIVSFLPLAEARLALPLALGYGLKPATAFLLAFSGSSLAAFSVLPLLKALLRAALPIRRKLNDAYAKKLSAMRQKADGKREKTSKKKKRADSLSPEGEEKTFKSDSATMLFLLAGFVALPLPMTGVYSGIIIAALSEMRVFRAATAITAGNMIACLLMLLLSMLLAPYINPIITALTVLAIITTAVTLVKVIGIKKK